MAKKTTTFKPKSWAPPLLNKKFTLKNKFISMKLSHTAFTLSGVAQSRALCIPLRICIHCPVFGQARYFHLQPQFFFSLIFFHLNKFQKIHITFEHINIYFNNIIIAKKSNCLVDNRVEFNIFKNRVQSFFKI